MLLTTLILCGAAYLVGSVPFGFLLCLMVFRDDIRRHGSGNIGATNVTRVAGWRWGAMVLLLDAVKGLLPTLAMRLVLNQQFPQADTSTAEIAAGVCAILGHMFPVWLGFKGGKGVATALGVVLIISPAASAAALVLFVIVFGITRIVALGSIIAASGFAGAQFLRLGMSLFEIQRLPLLLFSILVPALIVWRHRSNIARIWRGQENRFVRDKSAPSAHTRE